MMSTWLRSIEPPSEDSEWIDWGRAILCVYLLASIPWRIAFCPDFSLTIQYPGFIIIDLLATIFFSYDTLCIAKLYWESPHQGSIIPTTITHIKEPKIKHNRQSFDEMLMLKQKRSNRSMWRVLLSCAATIPFEYASILFGGEWLANYFMANRLLRLFYLKDYLECLSIVLGKKGHFKNIGVRRTWALFFSMALAGHLCGCGFYYVARKEAENGFVMTWPEIARIYTIESKMNSKGSHQAELIMESTLFEAYIKSLYWAYITMITTGFGDIVPMHIRETVWCIFSMFVGVIITALTIANLQQLVTSIDASRLDFQRKMEMIKKFMRYRRLPLHLRERIQSFYDYQWDVLKGEDEEKFLVELPRSLQQQVTNFMCRDIIASLPILRKANTSLLNAVVECAVMNIFSPNDEIIQCGDKLRDAVLVSRGEVEIMKGSIVERKMKRLDRFAEECLFVEKVSSHTVRSKGFSEVFLLPAVAFQKIILSQCDKNHIAQMKETSLALSKNNTKANKMFGSADDLTPTKGFQKHCHPNSYFRKLWNSMILLGLIFYIFSIPLSFFYLIENTPFTETPLLLIMGYAVDVFFVVDAVFEFHYFMHFEAGLIVFDKNHIHQQFYKSHNCFREVVGILPFDLLSCLFGGKFVHLFRLSKIARIPNIAMFIESADILLAELKIDIDLSLYRVIKLNILMITVCHWVGCIWFMMASISIASGYDQNWRNADENNSSLSISHSDFGGFGAYLRSVYWAIVGMSTVGYGDIIPTNVIETTYATFTILFGGLLLPAVVGGLAAYMCNFNIAAKLYQKRLAKVRSYLLRIKIGGDVLDKVTRYYDFHWSRQGGVMENDTMDELPGPLRFSVASHINGETIKSVPFLCACDESTKQVLVLALQPRVFIPSDCIIQEGERGIEMFFLERGRIIVSTSQVNVPLLTLSTRGDFFGECCLIDSSPTCVTAKACTYCECFVLSKEDFKDALEGSLNLDAVKDDIENTINQIKLRNERIALNFTHPKCSRLMIGQMSEATTEFPKSSTPALLLPGSRFLLIWDSFLLTICIFIAWVIPFRLAFKVSTEVVLVDWALDTFFLLDMLLHFRYVAFIQDGKLVTDVDKIKHHYLSKRFKIDLISTFPFDLVAFLILPKRFILVVEGLRVLKLIRLGRHFQTLEKIFRVLLDRGINLAPLRLIEFLSGVVLIAHWAACGFFALARWKNHQANCTGIESSEIVNGWANELAECLWTGTWIKRQIVNGKLPLDGGVTWQHYIRSFNWALPTLVVVVIGDVVPTTSPETLYAFLWMVVGVTINASIIGNVANIVSNLETDSSDFARKVDEIKSYMFKHKLSNDLHSRVDEFTRYLWSAHCGSTNEDDFILRLPYTLQTAVIEHTRTKHIRDCQFFDFCSPDIVKALSLCLKPLVFCAGDIVCHYGDMGQEMFFLEHGKVDVLSADRSTCLAKLHEGSFFGETSLFLNQPRTTSVCATTFCDIFEMGKEEFLNELRRRDFDLEQMLRLFASIHAGNTRRNKAVQDNLSASKKKHTKLSKIIERNDESMAKMQEVEAVSVNGSGFRFCWDIACTMLIMYLSLVVLYWVAFRDEKSNKESFVSFGFMIDMFFMIDFYLRSTEFCFPANNKYTKHAMIVDLISSLSVLDMLSYKLTISRYFRLLCLLRILRIPYFFNELCHHLSLRDIRISLGANLLCKLGFFYAIANHWCACIWFIIHRYLERNHESTWATSDCPFGGDVGGDGCLAKWDETLGEHNVCNLDSMRDCYIRALHFAITSLSTVGYGDISPVTELETIWENCIVLIGACFLAGLIGAFGAYLSQNDSLGLNSFKMKIQKQKNYMKYRNIPDNIQSNILFYHQCRWQNSQTLDERETLRILPESLQFDISFAVKERAIKSVPILKTLSTITQRRFAHALVLQVYPPHATIYNVGDIGWEIYFIVSGVVSVSLPADLSELDTTGKSNAAANKQKFESTGKMLSIGNHIGESCLSSKSGVRQETITAKTTVELYALSKDDLYNICRFMSLDKKKNLIESFLRRNGNVWHSFDDECPDLDADEVTDTSQSSSFPWSAQNNLTQLTIGPINKSKTMVRRRRLSLAQARIRSLSYTSRDGPGTMFSEHQIKHNDDADSVKDQDQSISSIVWDPGGAS